MLNNKKYTASVEVLTTEETPDFNKALDHDKIEQLLISSNFFNKVPFSSVNLTYRCGLKNQLMPEYQQINETNHALPIAIELKLEILKWANENNFKLLDDIFMIGALEALIQVGEKYDLPTHKLKLERLYYGRIPETIEECIDYQVRY